MATDDKEEIAMAECGSCRAVIPLDSNECPECVESHFLAFQKSR